MIQVPGGAFQTFSGKAMAQTELAVYLGEFKGNFFDRKFISKKKNYYSSSLNWGNNFHERTTKIHAALNTLLSLLSTKVSF